MDQTKRYDINKCGNFLKKSADKAKTLSSWNAVVEDGKSVKEIDDNLGCPHDNKQRAELLLKATTQFRSLNASDRQFKMR